MSKLYTSGSAVLPIILITATSISAIAISTAFLTKNDSISQENIDKVLDETLAEITNYLQISDAIGKYQEINGVQKINKIVLMIKPMVTCDIDLYALTIKLESRYDVKILNYSGLSDKIYSYSLFRHPIWRNISDGTFGCIITHDIDDSISKYGIINSHTDMVYLIIPLPDDLQMKYKDTLRVTIFPSAGTVKTITLEAPLPMKHIIDFIWDT